MGRDRLGIVMRDDPRENGRVTDTTNETGDENMSNMTEEVVRLLATVNEQENAATRRYGNACEVMREEGRDEYTPLDAARIEYNRGEMTAYRTVASMLRAILDHEASRSAASLQRIRESRGQSSPLAASLLLVAFGMAGALVNVGAVVEMIGGASV